MTFDEVNKMYKDEVDKMCKERDKFHKKLAKDNYKIDRLLESGNILLESENRGNSRQIKLLYVENLNSSSYYCVCLACCAKILSDNLFHCQCKDNLDWSTKAFVFGPDSIEMLRVREKEDPSCWLPESISVDLLVTERDKCRGNELKVQQE